MDFRTEYNYDIEQIAKDTATYNKEPSLTRQEFAEDADINVIVERLGLGYTMPMNVTPPMQGDFSTVPDFRGARDMIRKAEKVFESLPAKTRARFDNDPQQYIDFFHDPANLNEAIALGLVSKPPQPPAPVDTPNPKGEDKKPA